MCVFRCMLAKMSLQNGTCCCFLQENGEHVSERSNKQKATHDKGGKKATEKSEIIDPPEHLQPKTLRKASVPPVSLLPSAAGLEPSPSTQAPKLVPPADAEKPKPVLDAMGAPMPGGGGTEKETSFTEEFSSVKSNLFVSPISSPNDVTMMSISVESQSDIAMATASVTSSTVSSEILDETLDESIMSDSLERYKHKNSGIKTL